MSYYLYSNHALKCEKLFDKKITQNFDYIKAKKIKFNI